MEGYLYKRGLEELGPLKPGKLKGLIAPDTLVWKIGMDDWTMAKDVPELAVFWPWLVSAPEAKPEPEPYSGAEYSEKPEYSGAEYSEEPEYSGAEYSEEPEYSGAEYSEEPEYSGQEEYSGEEGGDSDYDEESEAVAEYSLAAEQENDFDWIPASSRNKPDLHGTQIPPEPSLAPPPPPQASFGDSELPRPNIYVMLSVVVAICFCSPLGFVGTFYGIKGIRDLNNGDVEAAKKSTHVAKVFTIIGLACSVLLLIIVVLASNS